MKWLSGVFFGLGLGALIIGSVWKSTIDKAIDTSILSYKDNIYSIVEIEKH